MPVTSAHKRDVSKSKGGGADLPAPISKPASARIWSALLGLLVLAMLSYSWMFAKVTVPNERSRVYLAVALVDHGSISIDEPIKRFGRVIDIAKFDGRYFTDKAPGSSLLGAAVYGVARVFTEPGDWTDTELVNLMRSWLMIPMGLLGFFLLRFTIVRLSLSQATADIVSLGWILGSSAYHYSTAFYGHQIVAVSLLGALVMIMSAVESRSALKSTMLLLGAGVLAGIAGLTEYQSAIPCVLLAVYAGIGFRRFPARLAAFALGAAPFVVLLFGYHQLAFGGPFELPYHHLVAKGMQIQHNQGIGGVTSPKAEAIFGSLLSLHRGIFTTSPMFALALIGFYHMWKQGKAVIAVVVGLALAYYLLFVFSAQVWHGGWGFGPRLLVPVMAWAVIPAAFAAEAFKGSIALGSLVRGFVICGLLYHQAVHLVFAEPPDSAGNPILDFVIPALDQGLLSPNLPSKLKGAPGLSSMAPAVFLIAAAMCVILLRGLSFVESRLGKALTVVLSAVPAAVLAIAVSVAGPSWPEGKTKHFIDNMKRYERAEYAAPPAAVGKIP